MEYPIFYIHLEQYIVGKLGYIPQLFTRYFCNLSCTEGGGGNPGTPAYVGGICIILRRQKNTSGYICITPLLVKLAYFLPPKKIWCDTYVSFFRQETSTFARAELRRGTQRAESELFLPCFQNFFFVLFRILCPRSCSRALLFCK